jgi:hypothetical protein
LFTGGCGFRAGSWVWAGTWIDASQTAEAKAEVIAIVVAERGCEAASVTAVRGIGIAAA